MPRRFRSFVSMASHSRHLEAGNRVIKTLNALMFSVLAGALIFVCFLACLKPWRQLCEKQEILTAAEKQLEKAIFFKEQKQKELQWIITDPAYFETIIRDKRDMAHKNETIIRIDHSKDIPVPPEEPKKKETESQSKKK